MPAVLHGGGVEQVGGKEAFEVGGGPEFAGIAVAKAVTAVSLGAAREGTGGRVGVSKIQVEGEVLALGELPVDADEALPVC